MSNRKILYHYGALAWVWRLLLVLFLIGGVGSLLLGAREREPGLFCVAAVFLAPALFFGMTLAVRVDCIAEDDLRVSTLLVWRRQICRRELGPARSRKTYEDEYGTIYAPRVWVPVRGRLPIYFDLLGKIPDRRGFTATFSVPESALPRKAG